MKVIFLSSNSRRNLFWLCFGDLQLEAASLIAFQGSSSRWNAIPGAVSGAPVT